MPKHSATDFHPEVMKLFDKYVHGIIDRRSGHLHPLNLCLGEARAAKSLGVAIHEDSRVLEMKGGAKPFARTAR